MSDLLRNRPNWAALPLLMWLAIACLVGRGVHAEEIDAYLVGDMAWLEVLENRVSLADHQITYPDGSSHTLRDKNGKVLLVNLWARWCVPCKDEMEDLATLQTDLGDDRFEVVALSIKKKSIKSLRKILKSWKAEHLLPYSHDPQALARVLYEQGLFTETEVSFVLPTTYLVNKSGEILAVREGFLHWNTPEARALISAMKDDRIR